MEGVNINILETSEPEGTGMGERSPLHHNYYCVEESLRRNGVAIMVNKRVRNAVLGLGIRNEAGQRQQSFAKRMH